MPQSRRKELGKQQWPQEKKAIACTSGSAATTGRVGLTARQVSRVAASLQRGRASGLILLADRQRRNAIVPLGKRGGQHG